MYTAWNFIGGSWHLYIYDPWLCSGVLACVILSLLLITSFQAFTRLLRLKLWKPLHRLSLLAMVLATFHVFAGAWAPRPTLLLLALVFALVYVTRWPAAKWTAASKRGPADSSKRSNQASL